MTASMPLRGTQVGRRCRRCRRMLELPHSYLLCIRFDVLQLAAVGCIRWGVLRLAMQPMQKGLAASVTVQPVRCLGDSHASRTPRSRAEGVYAVAWCPTQPDLVATGGADDRAFIWRVGQDAFEQTGGATLELGGHTDTVCALAFNAAGDALASGGMDGRVKVWEAASGRCIQTLEGPGDAVEWVRWHPKGNVVLAGASDFTAWMWLAQTGACMQVGAGGWEVGERGCRADTMPAGSSVP